MPPSQTQCTIPAEVKQAGGPMLMTQLFAYGPEANFSWPDRPANAPQRGLKMAHRSSSCFRG